MPEPAERGHDAAHGAADERRTAAGERAVVRQGLGKAHGNPGTDRSGEADEKCRPGIVGGEGGGKERGKSRD